MGEVAVRKNRTRYFANWAAGKRYDLIQQLGGMCAKCGSTKKLEFDHPNGRDWNPAKKNRWMRMIIYIREAKQGLIRLLCKRCNCKDGGSRRYG